MKTKTLVGKLIFFVSRLYVKSFYIWNYANICVGESKGPQTPSEHINVNTTLCIN